jgi:hypothetical protein
MVPVKESSSKGDTILFRNSPLLALSFTGIMVFRHSLLLELAFTGTIVFRNPPLLEFSFTGTILFRNSPLLELSFTGTIVFRYLFLQLFLGSNHFHLRSFGGCCNPIPLLNRKKHALNLFPDIFIYFQKKSVILE